MTKLCISDMSKSRRHDRECIGWGLNRDPALKSGDEFLTSIHREAYIYNHLAKSLQQPLRRSMCLPQLLSRDGREVAQTLVKGRCRTTCFSLLNAVDYPPEILYESSESCEINRACILIEIRVRLRLRLSCRWMWDKLIGLFGDLNLPDDRKV
jgi:hypothetical protein